MAQMQVDISTDDPNFWNDVTFSVEDVNGEVGLIADFNGYAVTSYSGGTLTLDQNGQSSTLVLHTFSYNSTINPEPEVEFYLTNGDKKGKTKTKGSVTDALPELSLAQKTFTSN